MLGKIDNLNGLLTWIYTREILNLKTVGNNRQPKWFTHSKEQKMESDPPS
jgi:hypothetical protein